MAAVVSAVALALVAAGCGGGDDTSGAAEPGQLSVIASFYPLVEAVERVGGDRVSVTNLTPAGAEPHDIELTPDQVEDLEDADLVVVLGRGFQPAAEEVAARRDGPTLELLDVLDLPAPGAGDEEAGGADEHEEEEAGGDHGHEDGVDPHVWLDPTLMAAVVDEVEAALADLDQPGATAFASGADAFAAELLALDESFESALSGCERSTIVVAHDAFGWLAARYGLEQESIAGLAPEAEPSPVRLSELTDLVEDEGITTVFTETLVSPRVAETLAREAGVTTAVLDPLEGLTDAQVAAGGSYTTVMEENRDALAAALGCNG